MNRLYEASSSPLKSKSRRVLSGEFAEFGTKNQNERIYPKNVYESALVEILPKIKEGRLLGECDHPDYDEVRLANVSHVIKECKVQGNKLYGTIELLDTPSGKIAQALVEAGIPLGISSRGIGNTRRIAEGTEVTDLKLITFDIVADPSFKGSYLTESKKATLNSRLSSIEKTLPLNESAGENQLIRDRINSIRDTLSSTPDITTDLVESIGSLTSEKLDLKEKLSEATSRNKSLRANMLKLQENYNATKSRLEKASKELSAIKKSMESDRDVLVESYESKILELEKLLAVEKRGLSKETVMPLLEGLTTLQDIECKLDSLKHLGGRRQGSILSAETLTEGSVVRKDSRLSRIISNV